MRAWGAGRVRRQEIISYLTAFGLISLPFVVASSSLIRFSLSDVPEAYLICIPLAAYFWIARVRHGGRLDSVGANTQFRAAVVLVLLAVVGFAAYALWGGHSASGASTPVLLGWPLWAGIVVWTLYGPNAVVRVVAPLLYLYLAWPPLYIAIINALNPRLEAFSYALLDRLARTTHWLTPLTGGTYLVRGPGGHGIAANVTAACSGSDSILALLVVFPVALTLFESSRARKGVIVAAGCLIALAANNLRIAAILWAVHQWGPFWGFDVIHPLLGPVLFSLILLLLFSYAGTTGRRQIAASASVAANSRTRIGGLSVAAMLLAALLFNFGGR